MSNAYPDIGKPLLFAFDTLIKLQNEGHTLILWTYRSGAKLQEAVAFCKDNGLEFYAVNKSYPEEEFDPSISRKINADVFIDDRNIGGMLGWGEIYHMISNHKPGRPSLGKQKTNKPTKKSLITKIEDFFRDDPN